MNEYQKKYEDLVFFRKYIQPINRWNRLNKVAREVNLPPLYAEYHHIKPAAIYPQLIEDQNNIVCLTAYEHIIAHKYLMLWYLDEYGEKDWKYNVMVDAYHIMHTRTTTQIIETDQESATIKILMSTSQSRKTKGKPKPPFTEQHRRNIGAPRKGKIVVHNDFETIVVELDKIPTGYVRGILISPEGKKSKSEKLSKIKRGLTFANNGVKQITCKPDQIPIGFVCGMLKDESRSERSKKSAEKRKNKIFVNNGQKTIMVYPDQIPIGFVKGKLVHKGYKITKIRSKEHKQHLSQSLSGNIIVNNGKIQLTCKPDQIPEGFVRGILPKNKKHWITNGIENTRIGINDNIPDGWHYGQTVSEKRRKSLSACQLGCKQLNNGIKMIKAKPDEIDIYLQQGYIYVGRVRPPEKQKLFIKK